MSTNFIPTDRNTLYLLPPSVQDWLPEDHLARFVVDIVSQLNLRSITEQYGGRGSKAYHPRMLLSLLFYGYATGIFSSRKLEQATYDSVAFRYIAANNHPDHDTIAAFRKRFLQQLKPLFVQILIIAKEMGLLKVGKVSLDGTKVKANASKHRALSWKYACKLEKQIQAEVDELMRLAQEADSSEISDEMNIPQELLRRHDRLEAIAEAKKKIEQRADERYSREVEEYERKVDARKAKAEETGKKPRGKDPKPPTAGPRDKDQVNLTDEESRIMPSAEGFKQAYNAQAAVDLDTMCVISAHTGYFSEANVNQCIKAEVTPLFSTGRQKHNQPLQERFTKPEPLPDNASPVEHMKYHLKTSEGKQLYGKRKSTVEPVFGIIKHVMGFRQFMLRGYEAVSGEWTLVSIAWNLKRMFALNG